MVALPPLPPSLLLLLLLLLLFLCPVEVESPSHLDLLMVSILKEPNIEMLLHACARGHASVVKSMVEKWPSEVSGRSLHAQYIVYSQQE